jgi:hypothetical protein
VIFISDTGPGIKPELRQRIFEPFFTTRGKDNGTGIGLFVVSQALSDMGGTIRVESEPGKGATFIVSLPAAPLNRPPKAFRMHRCIVPWPIAIEAGCKPCMNVRATPVDEPSERPRRLSAKQALQRLGRRCPGRLVSKAGPWL